MKCNARQLENGKCGLTGEGCIGKDCLYNVAMTNGDRIRAMSDREMASFMAERTIKESCLRLADEGYQPTATQIAELSEKLHRTWMMWLEAPADSPELDARNLGIIARAIIDRPYMENWDCRDIWEDGGGDGGGGTAV